MVGSVRLHLVDVHLDTRLNALKASSSKATARAKLEALKKERAGQAAGDRTI